MWCHQLTGGFSSELNSVEGRNRDTRTGCLEKFCCMSVKQNVQVRAVDIIRSDVGGGRTAALAVADRALYPAEADLSPETRANQKGPDNAIVIKRTVFPVFMSRWNGNSDAKAGSVVAATILESIGCV